MCPPAEHAASSWSRRMWPRGFRATMRPRVRASAALALGLVAFGAWWPDDLSRDEAWFVRVSWAAFMIRTFWFHAGLALLADAALAWVVRARVTAAVLALVGVAIVWPTVLSFVPRAGAPGPGQSTLTVLSANLLFGRADARKLAGVVASTAPDVIVFQEYTHASAAFLQATLADQYPHRFEHARDDAFGQAVYSRLPFAGAPRAFPPGPGWSEPQIRVEVEFDGMRVGIMNIHVMPPTSLSMIREQRDRTLALSRLVRDELAGAARGSALIVAGDLNATPESEALELLCAAGLNDAHADAGFGRGSTWPRDTWLKWAPGVRIDHVLASDSLRSIHSGVSADIGSDHRPTFARFVRAPAAR